MEIAVGVVPYSCSSLFSRSFTEKFQHRDTEWPDVQVRIPESISRDRKQCWLPFPHTRKFLQANRDVADIFRQFETGCAIAPLDLRGWMGQFVPHSLFTPWRRSACGKLAGRVERNVALAFDGRQVLYV
ncbi:hypothetical protein C0Q88_25195 [Ralstonia pickettii]|uniref:Uncharacterized protein n=1 Tax=Ralstonia pickettii TaxID=329 RepID=A0A2N4TJX7_RALPI|nr:hypothetical protein C0Q88_25195 [Ralstonia pickettii]